MDFFLLLIKGSEAGKEGGRGFDVLSGSSRSWGITRMGGVLELLFQSDKAGEEVGGGFDGF